mgnify:CR=1 FL=1
MHFIKNMVHSSRYVWGDKFFASPDRNPANKCFCRTRNDYKKCDGIFHLGTCYFDVPAAISKPHFLDASEYIRNAVDGLIPNINDHESSVDIEKVSLKV